MKVKLGAKPQKRPAQADRGAVHEHEFARHLQPAALLFQRAHNGGDFAPAILAGLHSVGNGAHAIVEQRPIDEARPDVERGDGLARQV